MSFLFFLAGDAVAGGDFGRSTGRNYSLLYEVWTRKGG
jgi:hypothetical protein